MGKAGPSVMAFPRKIISRTFQEASAARADHLVCLAKGAGSVAT